MIRTTTVVCIALLPAACVTSHEGTYTPACVAYEGERIELRAGRFEWQRFTDQRTVDQDGNIVDPFPDYPKVGAYRIDAGHLELVTNDDKPPTNWFLVRRAGEQYLLTSDQHKAFVTSQALPDCPLQLTRTGT